MRSLIVVALLLAVAAPHVSAEETPANPTIVDGDTIDLKGTRIRLHGIDAPEAGQKCKRARRGTWKCGKAALDRLTELSKGGISCFITGSDQHARYLAVCRQPDGTDINQLMVVEGYAWAFKRYSQDYVAAEDQAKARGLGVWQAQTVTAWDYRASKWAIAEQQAPEGCPVKGNISKGNQIYHAPWSPWYTKTKINVKKGERWFCTEREALDAGWRAPIWGR